MIFFDRMHGYSTRENHNAAVVQKGGVDGIIVDTYRLLCDPAKGVDYAYPEGDPFAATLGLTAHLESHGLSKFDVTLWRRTVSDARYDRIEKGLEA